MALLTMRFDAGTGNDWYVAPQLSDSGVELRAKVIKAMRVTGAIQDASFQMYTFGPTEGVDVAAIEAGTGSSSGSVALTDTAGVAQSQRTPLNCPNALLHTVRVAGTWADGDVKSRIDELEYELSIQDARR